MTNIGPYNDHHYSNNNYLTAFNNLSSKPTIINGNDPKSHFTNNKFMNDNTLLHNNLNTNLLDEEIREYSVMIDSKDRNYQIYPDPFNYEVKFHPLPKSKSRHNGKIHTFEEPAPIINDNFTNVRYIKLQEIILPHYHKIRKVQDYDEENDEIQSSWKVNPAQQLNNNMYIVLSLGREYANENYKSTNDVLADGFSTIYYDSKANDTHYFGCTSNGTKYFPKDNLAKIDKLKISFMDPYGNPLSVPHLDKNIHSNMICTCEKETGDDDTTCFKHNLFHPLNPIFQHHIHLKIGIVMPRLSKNNFC